MAYPGALTPAEHSVIWHAARGTVAALAHDGGERPPVSAALVRQLLLGHAAAEHAARHGGVRIAGARIEGGLDLSDCAAAGLSLPALVLEDCDIDKPMNLRSARLARLSIARSRFASLDLREADIDGPLDFSDAEGFVAADGTPQPAWIDARGSIINGEVAGSGARLRHAAPRPQVQIVRGERYAALMLAGADIRGSVRLMRQFVASGGVSLDAAQVGGDLWAQGATVSLGEGDAFRAQNARIDGVMVLDGITVTGMIWLLGARIGGTLSLQGARIYGRTSEGGAVPGPERKALEAGDAEIGASVDLREGFLAHGVVSFSATRVRADFLATGASMFNRTADGFAQALVMTNAEIGARVDLDEAGIDGQIDMIGARIGGALSFAGAKVANDTRSRAGRNDGIGTALQAINLTVGGDAEFGPANPRKSESGSIWRGRIDLTGARIAGDLSFNRCWVANHTPSREDKGKGEAIVARRVHVNGSISFQLGCYVEGAVILTGSTIGRDLRCDNAVFFNPGRSAIYGKDIEIGDDLRLIRTLVRGDLRFERAAVTGSVQWSWLSIGLAPDDTSRADEHVRFELMHARIGSALKAEYMEYTSRTRLDCSGMRASSVSVALARWNGAPERAQDHPVKLDGFVYDRIDKLEGLQIYRANLSLRRDAGIPTCPLAWWRPPADPIADLLLDVLLRQPQAKGKGGSAKGRLDENFHPQPYRQLARVLRAQGEESSARSVAIAEQWATPRGRWATVFYRPYGMFFGFGFRPGLAILVLLFYVAIGAVGVWLAKSQPMVLVETPALSTDLYNSVDHRRAFVPASAGAIQDIPCSDAVSRWPDYVVYAADMVLPFIPLHQEAKCEINAGDEYLAWRICKAGYVLFGWIVASLTLLTVSGIMKRFDRDTE